MYTKYSTKYKRIHDAINTVSHTVQLKLLVFCLCFSLISYFSFFFFSEIYQFFSPGGFKIFS